MSAATAAQQGSAATDGGDTGRAAVERAAEGKKLDGAQERSALDYLLGAPEPARYKVTVQYETPEGMRDLAFHFHALDGRRIDKIEQSHIDERTAMMDKSAADAELVVAATDAIEDVATGQKVAIKAESFRTVKEGEAPLANPADALLARLGTQAGVIAGVARAIREAGGWSSDRVGKASRLLVSAAEN